MPLMNGWARLDEPALDPYWLDGFPPSDDPIERHLYGRGPDFRKSPIYEYRDGGIGRVQWLNVSQDKAAILVHNGGWKYGGPFHLWISSGIRTVPYLIVLEVVIKAGDPSGWERMKDEAIDISEQLIAAR